jgi:hypothetical protein
VLHRSAVQNFMPVLDEVWFILSENMNTENDVSCCYKNVHAFCDIPLLDFKIGVWYMLNASKIIGTICLKKQIPASVRLLILTPSYREL